MNVVYLTCAYSKQSGGGLFTETIRRGLELIPDVNVILYEFDTNVPKKKKIESLIHGYSVGVTPAVVDEIIAVCQKNNATVLFASYTYFGKLCAVVKKALPRIRVVSLAQNVEFIYFWELIRLRCEQWLKKMVGVFNVYYNEWLQLKVSDYTLGLNMRDSRGFYRLYRRVPDAYLPIVLVDRFGSDKRLNRSKDMDCDYALFVGSKFPPNEFGVKWLAENVAPQSPLKIVVVGKGMEDLRPKYSSEPNLEIVGTVDDLSSYYYGARLVICPIFHGSGMKVKTVEALMFGKQILATREALEGYEVRGQEGIIECNSANAFLKAMNACAACEKYVAGNRQIYLRNHSMDVLQRKLKIALGLNR